MKPMPIILYYYAEHVLFPMGSGGFIITVP